jgi:hypothetical protein
VRLLPLDGIIGWGGLVAIETRSSKPEIRIKRQ